MVKTVVILHQTSQGDLTGMTEGTVSKVVRQANRLDQVFICAESPRNCASNLGDFKGMGQAGAVVIAFIVDEYLGLVLQPAEGGCVQDPIAVALE